MKPYVDRIFESYRKSSPRLAAHLTQEHWLSRENGWRTPLKEIGERTKRICDIDNIKVARREWKLFAYNSNGWVRSYLQSAPLLDYTAHQADYNDDTFRQFMKDLATLADL